MVAVFVVAVVLPNPEGEGWANRVIVQGHWVPAWECYLAFWSVFAWFLTVLAVWVIRDIVSERTRRRTLVD